MSNSCPFFYDDRDQIVNCLICDYCLPPFDRSDGNMCGFDLNSDNYETNNRDNG